MPDALKQLARIGEQMLRDRPRIVDRIVRVARKEVPTLGVLPPETNRALVDANFEWTVRSVLIERRAPTPEELGLIDRAAEFLSPQGVGLDSTLLGLQVAIREAWSVALEAAEALRIDTKTLADLIRARDRWADAVTSQMVTAYQVVEAESMRRDERLRADYLNRLIVGTAGRDTEYPRSLGLDPDAPYFVVRTRGSEEAVRSVERRLSAELAASAKRGLFGMVDGDFVGIVAAAPHMGDSDLSTGVARARSLWEIPNALSQATSALETAIAFGLTGAHSLETLQLRSAVIGQESLSELLLHQYVEPLKTAGTFGGLLRDTLRALFDNGFRMNETAKALFIHPNTLRHRLRRYESMTGARLDKADDLVGIWWAMEWERASRRESTAPPR